MKKLQTMLGVLAASFTINASATPFIVTITNNGPADGVFFTPVWVGFHNGTFDTYNLGEATSPALETLAELGDTAPLSMDFSSSAAGTAGGIDGTVLGTGPGGMSPPPLHTPGNSASMVFDLANDGSNQFFSYASMILPTSDYFMANGDPMAISLADLLNGLVEEVSFTIGAPGTVVDAGTEVNDFANSPANPLFGIPGGDPVASDDNDPPNVSTLAGPDPFANFLSQPADPNLLLPLNFNNAALYPNGIGTITIRAVPEPSTIALFSMGTLLLWGASRRRRDA